MNLIVRVLEVIFPVFVIAGTGYLYGLIRKPQMERINQLNMDVFIPALIFHVLAVKSFDLYTYLWLFIGGVVIVLGSGLLAYPLAKTMHTQVKTFIPPMMFYNGGNMGLALALFAFGEQALPGAVVLFLAGTTLNFTIGIYILDRRTNFFNMLRTPLIVTTIAGLLFSINDWSIPVIISTPIEMMGRISIPLMLFSLGVRLVDLDLGDWHTGMFGALARPILGVICAAAVLFFVDLPSEQRDLLLLYAVLPPAVINFMLAEIYKQEPGKVASIVSLGNLAALITMPAVLMYIFSQVNS